MSVGKTYLRRDFKSLKYLRTTNISNDNDNTAIFLPTFSKPLSM